MYIFRVLKIKLVYQYPRMKDTSVENSFRILLTGGSGFLGIAILREVLGEDSPLAIKEVVV